MCVCSWPGSVHSLGPVSAPVPHLWSLGPQILSGPADFVLLISGFNSEHGEHWAWSHRNQWVPSPAPARWGQAEQRPQASESGWHPGRSVSHLLSRVTWGTSLPMILHHQRLTRDSTIPTLCATHSAWPLHPWFPSSLYLCQVALPCAMDVEAKRKPRKRTNNRC